MTPYDHEGPVKDTADPQPEDKNTPLDWLPAELPHDMLACRSCLEHEARTILMAMQVSDAMYGMALGFSLTVAMLGFWSMIRRPRREAAAA